MKKIISCFVLFFCMCLLLTGCSKASLSMPTNYLNVTSNGGFVVTCGDYIYFANAYKSYTSLSTKADNDGSLVAQHSLKRVGFDLTSNTTKTLRVDESENVKFENVIDKIAGYETSNMWVVNEYLYFTSPNVHKNDSKDAENYNKYQFDLVSLFRIKLDGSDFKELYTTETNASKFYLTNEEKARLFIFDNSEIKVVNVGNNETGVKTVAEDVKQVAFPNNQETTFVDLYFSVERDAENDAFSGDILKKYNLATGNVSEVAGYSNNKEKLNLIAFDGTNLFYTRTGRTIEALYSNDFSSGLNSEVLQKNYIDNFKDNAVILTINSDEYGVECFVYEYNKNIYMQNLTTGNDQGYSKLTDTDSEIAFVDGTYVYYTTSEGIYRVSVLTKNIQEVAKVSDFNKDCIDFDGRYVYFYAKAENGTTDTKYLYRADTITCGLDETIFECVAQLHEDEIADEEAK